MQLNFVQYIAFFFMLGWVVGDVISLSHHEKILFGTGAALLAAYLNNAHGILWKKIKPSRKI